LGVLSHPLDDGLWGWLWVGGEIVDLSCAVVDEANHEYFDVLLAIGRFESGAMGSFFVAVKKDAAYDAPRVFVFETNTRVRKCGRRTFLHAFLFLRVCGLI